jgi:hypothetical protein
MSNHAITLDAEKELQRNDTNSTSNRRSYYRAKIGGASFYEIKVSEHSTKS